MKEMINMREMMKAVYKLEGNGQKATLLGIGPMSETLIFASLKLAKKMDFPIMFIASRNQIDSAEFGRGYVRNWDQYDFVNTINKIAGDIAFDGLYYICRDHGGPWQRDEERAAKLPAEEAMRIAKRSYLTDLLAGFNLLHIDPTKDPHAGSVVPMDTVIERTVELIEYIEDERKKRNLPPVDYEAGTEETNGGLTSIEAYEDFINQLCSRLNDKGLPLPLFIVGQTGTLTRHTENVGNFDAQAATKLVSVARKYGVGLKEHNADYLSDEILLAHPALGITASNVAPEYGVAETVAYTSLAATEQTLLKTGLITKASNLADVLREETIKSERWRKWMTGSDSQLSVAEVLADDKLASLIAKIGGHYTFENPKVKQEMSVLFESLKMVGVDAQTATENCLIRVMQRYSDCFGLNGLTTRIKSVVNA